jgi:hypothetical protein
MLQESCCIAEPMPLGFPATDASEPEPHESWNPADAGNRVIQTLWIGDLSPLEETCMTSFAQQGHEVHLYAYQRPPRVPAGVRVCAAEEILPASAVFRNRIGRGKGSYACFADLFRYKLLWQRGGWWVDADICCLRAFDFAAPYVFVAEGDHIANGVIKAPAGCELMRRCYEEAARCDHRRVVWNELGTVFSQAVQDLRLTEYVLPPQVFSPIPFGEIVDHVRGRRHCDIPHESYAIHLYQEMWRRNRLDKYREYPADSIYERLRRQAGVPAAAARRIAPYWREWLNRFRLRWAG